MHGLQRLHTRKKFQEYDLEGKGELLHNFNKTLTCDFSIGDKAAIFAGYEPSNCKWENRPLLRLQ